MVPHSNYMMVCKKKKVLTWAFSLLFILITVVLLIYCSMNSKSQRTPLVRRKIRKEPKALWPSCQSHPVCAAVHQYQLHTLLWHRHMPSWLSHGIRLVTHSIDKTLCSSSHTSTLLSLSCHVNDASRTAKLVSKRPRSTDTHRKVG